MPKVPITYNGTWGIQGLSDEIETWNGLRDLGTVAYFTEKNGKYYWAGSLDIAFGNAVDDRDNIGEVCARVWKDGLLRETNYAMRKGTAVFVVVDEMETACKAPEARDGDMD